MQKASANVSGVPSGWTDDGTTLKAPNGVAVVHGMRAFVLGNTWDATDVPLAAEQSESEVEIGNTSLGAGVVQWFLKSGQLSWVDSREKGLAIADVGPVAFSEGMRMASSIYAARVVEKKEEAA